MKKHIIIGAGISGISLANHLKEINNEDEIIIIDKDIESSTSMNSNNLYLLKNDINNSLDLIKNALGIKYINIFSIYFIIHCILIQLVFFIYIKNINKYFSKRNYLPIERKRCKNILIYDIKEYKKFVDSFIIIKDIFISYKIDNKTNKILINTKENNFICDFFYDCTANANNFSLIKIGSDSIYVEVDKIKIDCLLRDSIYWILPLENNILKISMNLYILLENKKNKNNFSIIEIKKLLKKYDMNFIEIKNKWYGNRTCSFDLIPFYQRKKKNIFIITGGSFLGFNILPAITKKISLMVNNKLISNDLLKYDLSINRIYKEIIIIYLLIVLIIFLIIKKKK